MGKTDDPTRIDEQLVVTVDAQLFYGLLEALPYLINYPYECTEQTLNRFLSTGILTSLYSRYPQVARMAEVLSKRETVYETFDSADPNRKMSLEETPWLIPAREGRMLDMESRRSSTRGWPRPRGKRRWPSCSRLRRHWALFPGGRAARRLPT